jgi:ABC-type antimicrobial peptide transport system permease subunit
MYSAVRRRREFALRSALGAGGAQLFVMMISGTLRPAIVGVAAGLAAGYAIARAMTVLLFRTDPSDARIYAIAALLALGVATSAAAIAARPMLRIAPAEVLRSE